nr:class II fructose-1,6-bisphosphate aldolase [Candidatus Sigynarchaeum springense]MDO8117823.1 class II fructose-1,6-bisphosphate aldolase [Candidatus Sigynarchaeota archaeon]
MVTWKEIGLADHKQMLQSALKGGYAVPGYNFNNMEQLQAILTGCVKSQSPVILQVSKGAREYANGTLLRYMAEGGVKLANELADSLKLKHVPISLHLDHGEDFEICKACIDNGFSSVMIDRSHDPIEKNIEETKRVVEYAHEFGVQVEGELGILAGKEDNVSAEKTTYTRPEDVEMFAKGTGVDSLAIAIGTSHGAYKFKPGQKTELRLDILQDVRKRLPDLPIVLHGASSVLTQYVDMINKFGGKMENAIGVPEDQLRKAASMGVSKINIDSDGRLVVTAIIRKTFAEKPAEFDPRKYLGPARDELIKMIMDKNKTVLGSEGKA